MNRYTVVWLYDALLFSNEKEWIVDAWYSMDGSQSNYAEWKKWPKNNTYYIITLIKILENANQSIVALGDQWFPEYLDFRLKLEIEETFGMIDMLIVLIVMLDSWMYTYIKPVCVHFKIHSFLLLLCNR